LPELARVILAELALSIVFRISSALRSTLLLTKFLVTSPLAPLLCNNASCGVLPQHRSSGVFHSTLPPDDLCFCPAKLELA